CFFLSGRRRHTRSKRDWSSDVCSSDLVKIWIEDEYVRAVRGGIGEAKTGGNYVASLKSQVKAHDEGYSQVLWLDGVERKYIEEEIGRASCREGGELRAGGGAARGRERW